MLLVLGVGMMFFIILHAIRTDEKIIKVINRELIFWILFAFSSLFTGSIVAVNFSHVFQSVITFIEFLVLIYGIVYISKQDKSIDYFINIFIIFSLVCGVTTVFWGVDLGNGRRAMGHLDNPNSLGILMVVGICCILYKIDIKKGLNTLVKISVIFFLMYVIVLTGSRKSLLSAVIIFLYWLFIVVKKDLKRLGGITSLRILFTLAIIISIAYLIFYPILKDSVLLERLKNLSKSEADVIRRNMYREAFEMFKFSPIVGVGMNNFRDLSIFKTYSHSTYAELLACTGIIGAFLYAIPYITVCIYFMKKIFSKTAITILKKELRMMFGLYCILVFLGIGVIHFYDMTSTIAFGLIFAFMTVYNSEIADISCPLQKEDT